MIVSEFQSWAETASPPSRADGVSALARAFLYSNLDDHQRQQAVLALTRFLDDPSVLVRRALADAFASAVDAPHAIVLALADDQPAVASIVLGRSPVLSDAELIDCAASVASEAQGAIAGRPGLSASVAAALAEVASLDALVVLAANLEAPLPPFAIRRMAERYGADTALRAALMARGDLPIDVRADLAGASARSLALFVMRAESLSDERIRRVSREAADRAVMAIAATCDVESGDLAVLAAHLRETGRVTPAFALRCLLSGHRVLFEAMLGELGGVTAKRVRGLARHFETSGFAALYRKAGFPLSLLPAFRSALAALRDGHGSFEAGGTLHAPLIERVLGDCAAARTDAFDKLLVLLRRFETESARDEARITRVAMLAAVVAPAAIDTPRPIEGDPVLAGLDFDEAMPMTDEDHRETSETARFAPRWDERREPEMAADWFMRRGHTDFEAAAPELMAA